MSARKQNSGADVFRHATTLPWHKKGNLDLKVSFNTVFASSLRLYCSLSYCTSQTTETVRKLSYEPVLIEDS